MHFLKVFSFIFTAVLLSSCATSENYETNIGFDFTKSFDRRIQITGHIHDRTWYAPGLIREKQIDKVLLDRDFYPHSHLLVMNLIDILQNQTQVRKEVTFTHRSTRLDDAIVVDIEIFEEAELDPNYGHWRYDLQYTFSYAGKPTLTKRIRKSSAGFGGCMDCVPKDLVFKRVNREISSALHDWW